VSRDNETVLYMSGWQLLMLVILIMGVGYTIGVWRRKE
jgi:hypothetical protein